MQSLTCQNCGEDFQIPDYKEQKYCSRDCVYDSQRGKSRSEETKKKIAEANRGKSYSDSRKNAISRANQKKIPKAKREKAIKWLSYGCMPHSVVKDKLGFSKRVYRRLRKDLVKNVGSVLKVEDSRPTHVYSKYGLTPHIILEIKDNLDCWNREEIKDKFFDEHVTLDTISNLCQKLYGRKPKHKTSTFHGGKTTPEKEVENFIIENGWKYEYNFDTKYEGDSDIIWYSIDFVIEDKVFVEVHGDYWHGNPEIYDWDDLYGHQRSTINKDRRKKAQLISQHKPLGYFEIWENDIKSQTSTYKKQKKDIICTVQNVNNQ